MTSGEIILVGFLLLFITALSAHSFLVKKRLREKEGALAAIEGEEMRMFGFLHLLGQAIAEERSLGHLYRTIVDGVEEVVAADGVALYLFEEGNLVPAHLSAKCPALITVPDLVREEGLEAISQWLRLGKVDEDGELLNEIARQPGGGRWKAAERELPDGIFELMAVPMEHGGRVYAVLAATRSEKPFSENDWEVFRSAGEQSAYGLGNALLHREVQEKRRLDDELRTAQEVQKVLLPSKNPDWSGYRVCGGNSAARLISGDYFDFLELGDDAHGVIIADVSGKGVAAGLLMASCRSALRAHIGDSAQPSEILAALNRQIFGDMRQDMFVSAAMLSLQNGSGQVTLARAGHDAPLLFRKESGEVQRLKPGGLALGIDKGPVFERVLQEKEFVLESGDVLLLYTDGVNEAEDTSGKEFGLDRLQKRFAELAPEGAEEIVHRLSEEVAAFSGNQPQQDDVTLVAIERI